MTRHAPALLALSIIAVAGWTYNVNYDTRTALDRLSGLRAEIAEQREALQVLRVEWAYLNAPDRLAGLVARHNGALGLAPLVPETLGIVAAVPYPPRPAPDAAPDVPDVSDALIAAGPGAEAGAQAPRREAEPEPESLALAALAEPGGKPVARPATLVRTAVAEPGAAVAPIPAAIAAPEVGPETVPAALEAAIAAALAEAGVQMDGAHADVPRGGIAGAPSASPAGILDVASAGVPTPATRPAFRNAR